jgi:hypothetical protein
VIPDVGLGSGRLAAEAADPDTRLVLEHPAVDVLVQACQQINNVNQSFNLIGYQSIHLLN